MGTKRVTVPGDSSPLDQALGMRSKALGEPSRLAIVQHLHTADSPVRVSELAEALGLHHNAIRAHLSILMTAGLVLRERATDQTRGRPAWVYRLSPEAGALSRGSMPLERLTQMLLDVITTGRSPREVGREHGVALAASGALGPEADGQQADARRVLEVVARDLGFEPEVEPDSPLEILLRRCPFAMAAAQARDVICGLHLGVAEGAAAAAGGTLRVEALHVADPFVGPCRLTLA